MTEHKSDFELLRDRESWLDPANNTARDAFVALMHGRSFGFDPLRDAWDWFIAGWRHSGK